MPIFELGRGCLDKSRVKIWFRLVEAFKSYRGDKPNDTRTRTRTTIFKVKRRSCPIGALKHAVYNVVGHIACRNSLPACNMTTHITWCTFVLASHLLPSTSPANCVQRGPIQRAEVRFVWKIPFIFICKDQK